MNSIETATPSREAAITFQRAILTRSARNRTFRDKLVATPRAAIADFIGTDESQLPAETARYTETPAEGMVTLPAYMGESDELSTDELEAVAGGSTPLILLVPATIAILDYDIGLGIGVYFSR